ncbi:unannotated protein [freshwater metagenome]|uniref:Unannotated protein n=1 Tax=freshwater metagenome TaxID=449393 RepID=A0A6J7VF85_9ZZZZ
MFGHPTVVTSHGRGDTQCEALLAEQCVAAVARTVGPDLAGFREVHDVLVLGIAGPCNIGLTGSERHANRMHTRNPFTVTKNVECALTHAGHDAHVHCDVGRVAELHTNVRNRRTERPHRERHDIHRAALHGTGVELGHLDAHFSRRTPVVRGACIDFVFGADVGAILNASNVAWVGECEVAVRTLRFVQRAEGATFDELCAEALVLFG